MLMDYIYARTGLHHFHSTDLEDMRRALLDDEGDEPDGGTADAAAPAPVTGRRVPAGGAERRAAMPPARA